MSVRTKTHGPQTYYTQLTFYLKQRIRSVINAPVRMATWCTSTSLQVKICTCFYDNENYGRFLFQFSRLYDQGRSEVILVAMVQITTRPLKTPPDECSAHMLRLKSMGVSPLPPLHILGAYRATIGARGNVTPLCTSADHEETSMYVWCSV